MSSLSFDNPELYRSVLDDLPLGVYIVDQDRRVRFWNHGAETLTGHLAHEALGHEDTGQLLQPCDQKGRILEGEQNLVGATLTNGRAQQFLAYFLHKKGHRVAVQVRTAALPGAIHAHETIAGAIVVFEDATTCRDNSLAPAMYGCLDATTGIPSVVLTRAVLRECIAGMEQSRRGFGLLRVRVLGMDEFRSKHGIQSAFPLLRTTAQTLRHSLDPENFVGRWGEDEFIVVLPMANPVTTRVAAEMVWSLVTHSEVSWWGDRFSVEAVVMHAVAEPGDKLERLLNGLEPPHAAAAGRAIGMAASGA